MPEPLLPPSELDSMSPIRPDIEAVIKAMNISAPPATTPEELVQSFRQNWSKLPTPPPKPGVEDSVSSFDTRDGTSLRLCIYRPASINTPLPLVVWYHGGGFCLGVPEMNAALLRDVALQHQCVVVAPQYRLAPEFKFPVQSEDGWDSLSHIAAHAQDFGADPSLGFVVGGESAGARMTAILSHKALDTPLKSPLTGTFLSAGAYFDKDNIPDEYKQHFRSRSDKICLASPFLSETSKKAFDACLLPDNSSPLHNVARSPSHTGLPRAYLQACGADILRDDSFLYRHLLESNGVETKFDLYPGCPHCFWFLIQDSEMGRKWKADSHAAFEWLLKA